MAPRKKPAGGGSKKGNQNHPQQSQPSKFGIQRFFDRRTQNSQNPKPKTPISENPLPIPPKNGVFTLQNPNPISNSEPQQPNPSNVPESGLIGGSKCPNNEESNTPTVDEMPGVGDVEVIELDVSPDIRNGGSTKRFKFSPRMLIKQSQDEGFDEVTWRISPVNERLNVKSKQLPGVMRVLAESSRLNSMCFQQCSEKKDSRASTGKLEKWLSSPPLKASKNSLILSNRISFSNVNSEQDMELHSADGGGTNGVSDQQDSRHHKKALLELLDQVGDAISTDEPVHNNIQLLMSRSEPGFDDEKYRRSDPPVEGLVVDRSVEGRREPPKNISN